LYSDSPGASVRATPPPLQRPQTPQQDGLPAQPHSALFLSPPHLFSRYPLASSLAPLTCPSVSHHQEPPVTCLPPGDRGIVPDSTLSTLSLHDSLPEVHRTFDNAWGCVFLDKPALGQSVRHRQVSTADHWDGTVSTCTLEGAAHKALRNLVLFPVPCPAATPDSHPLLCSVLEQGLVCQASHPLGLLIPQLCHLFSVQSIQVCEFSPFYCSSPENTPSKLLCFWSQ
jgi:hypothetical protein